MKARLWHGVRIAIPLAFLGAFFAWPLVAIFRRSFSARALVDVLGDHAFWDIAWFTVWQALVSTALTLAVGLPIAYVVARYRFPGRGLFRAFVTVPFVLPTVVVATAFLALLRDDGALGFLGWQRGVAPMLAAHVFFNVAVVVRVVGGLWTHLDPRREEAARMLGASRSRAFREVTLPLLVPAIAAAASIVLLFTLTSFGVVLLLSDPAHSTLEVEIYRQTVEVFDLPTAAALAIVQLACVAVLVVAFGRLQERQAFAQRLVAAADTARKPRGRERLVVAGVLGLAVLFLGLPLLVLVLDSFRSGGGWGFGYYRALSSSATTSTLFVPPGEALRNSLQFAAIAAVLAVVVGGLAATAIARRPSRGARSLDVVLMIPLGASAVTVGFGLLLALEQAPFGLATNPVLVPIAQAVVAIPFVVRAMVPVLRSVDPRLREAATMLGASPRRVWKEVDLPITMRALLVGAGFAIAVSLGEFGATLFVARPDWPTMPLAISRFLSRPGALNFGQAMAMATILMAVTAVVIVALERARVRGIGEL